jgi:head-tail adaptor
MLTATDPVEVWRTSVKAQNAYTSKPDWTQAVKVWEGLGSVQPDSAYESYSPARDISQERRAVFLPVDADVTATDRLYLEGHWYEVEGEPRHHTQTSRRHIRLVAWRDIR